MRRADAYEQYDRLVQMGGRPSAPINEDPREWNPAITDEHLHVSYHWGNEFQRTLEELDRWKAF